MIYVKRWHVCFHSYYAKKKIIPTKVKFTIQGAMANVMIPDTSDYLTVPSDVVKRTEEAAIRLVIQRNCLRR